MAVAVFQHELRAQCPRPLPARHNREATSRIERRVPWHVAIGREIKRVEAECPRLSSGAVDQRRAEAVALPAVQHRQLVEPGGAALELHQGEAYGMAERRGCDPEPVATQAAFQ